MFDPVRQRSIVVAARRRLDRRKAADGIGPFPYALRLFFATVLVFGLVMSLANRPASAQECPPAQRGLSQPVPSFKDMVNPNPLQGDIELPMPCGGKMTLRPVCVPADGYFGDQQLDLGCEDCGRENLGFMEGKRKGAVSGPFTLQDLPELWRLKLTVLAKMGDGRCPNPKDDTVKGFYYFIGKYEISNFQWGIMMEADCPGPGEPLTVDAPRPKTGISWFEAVDFTQRYTEWLLKNRRDSLPTFLHGRYGYFRLPTEAEWEYAAKGGHLVPETHMNQEEFFPLKGRSYGDYAVYTDEETAKVPERLARIGSKCPNPSLMRGIGSPQYLCRLKSQSRNLYVVVFFPRCSSTSHEITDSLARGVGRYFPPGDRDAPSPSKAE